jgi:hypothetical protein
VKRFRSVKGGMREDLGCYFRSAWEANYARYLDLLKEQGQIQGWSYESKCFEFEGIKRGTKRYYPDFEVINSDGSEEYHEVKGYMTQKARTQLRRMKLYYPDVKVVLIDAKAYNEIKRKVGGLIKYWE